MRLTARLILIACLFNLTFATGCATIGKANSSEPEQATSDAPAVCQDPRYLELKKQDLDELSEREYEYFRQKDHACNLALAQQEQSEDVGRSVGGVVVGLGLVSLISTIAILAWTDSQMSE